jgi:hypothetical protein
MFDDNILSIHHAAAMLAHEARKWKVKGKAPKPESAVRRAKEDT